MSNIKKEVTYKNVGASCEDCNWYSFNDEPKWTRDAAYAHCKRTGHTVNHEAAKVTKYYIGKR